MNLIERIGIQTPNQEPSFDEEWAVVALFGEDTEIIAAFASEEEAQQILNDIGRAIKNDQSLYVVGTDSGFSR